jgi:serine/threonine-protein kinase
VGERFEAEGRIAALIDRLADRYEFRTLLGEGGAGTVFEVVNRALGRSEALKILTGSGLGDDAARFAGEARIAASLDHPRIVKIYEFGEEAGALWYSMQLVEGPTLAALADGGRLLDGAEAARVAIPVLDALDYSHGRGVVHRDIKPANILFSLEGRPFLTDYGIAKAVENPLDTRTGQLLGTPAYVAPEQALGEAVDARADLYSLGVTLYRAVSGELPFKADGVLQTLLLRLREDPPHLSRVRPDLDPGVAAVIMRALARDPAGRWPGAREMREALLEACRAEGLVWDRPLEGVGAFAPEARPLVQEPRPNPSRALETTADLPRARKRPAWVVAGLLAAALVLGWTLRPRRAHAVAAPPPQQAQGTPEPPSVKKRPAPAEAPETRPRPQEAPPPVRRPVVYPQLLGDGAVAAPVAGCGGRSVDVSLVVGEDGLVKACKVLSAVDPACAEAARAIALRYHFRPALDAQGQPVQTTVAAAVVLPEAP